MFLLCQKLCKMLKCIDYCSFWLTIANGWLIFLPKEGLLNPVKDYEITLISIPMVSIHPVLFPWKVLMPKAINSPTFKHLRCILHCMWWLKGSEIWYNLVNILLYFKLHIRYTFADASANQIQGSSAKVLKIGL